MKDFFDFMLSDVERLKAECRFGSVHIYTYAYKSFRMFCDSCATKPEQISRELLKSYENHLLMCGKSLNTVSTYMRTLRAVYNRAMDDGIVPVTVCMFKRVFTGVQPSRKLAVKPQEFREVISCDESSMSLKMRKAKDLLELSMLLQGIPFVDLCYLRKSDLHADGRGGHYVSCRRRKCNTPLTINVSKRAMTIILRYSSKSLYLLDMLDGSLSEEGDYKAYKRALGDIDYNLRKVLKLSGVKLPHLSTYTARHTWATTAKMCFVPIEVISQGLGHSSSAITNTYLKTFEGNELDKASKIVYDTIFSGKQSFWGRK